MAQRVKHARDGLLVNILHDALKQEEQRYVNDFAHVWRQVWQRNRRRLRNFRLQQSLHLQKRGGVNETQATTRPQSLHPEDPGSKHIHCTTTHV